MRQVDVEAPCTLNVAWQSGDDGSVQLVWHTTVAEAARRLTTLDAQSRAHAWISLKGGRRLTADEIAAAQTEQAVE